MPVTGAPESGAITLTANPAGLNVDEISTTLTVTTGAGVTLQTIAIPVTMTFGNSLNGNTLPSKTAHLIYLPLLMK